MPRARRHPLLGAGTAGGEEEEEEEEEKEEEEEGPERGQMASARPAVRKEVVRLAIVTTVAAV